MNLFAQLKPFSTFAICLTTICLLTACQPEPPHPQLKILDTAIKEGKLDNQAAALKILIEDGKSENIPGYQMALEDINVVKQLNQRAKQQLGENELNALEIAISADKKRFNKDSRAIIAQILLPFIPYYELKPYLQQWSYPRIDKVVVSGLMPSPITPWAEPLNIPAVWPDKQLIKLLQTPNKDILRQLAKLAEEHQQWLEIDRLASRMLNKAPQQGDIILLYDDVTAINQMYNLVVSDLRYYYLTQEINQAKQQIDQQLAMLNQSQSQSTERNLDLDWQNLQHCCQDFLQALNKPFAYLPTASDYVESVSQVNQQWHQWLDNLQPTKTKTTKTNPLTRLTQLKRQLVDITTQLQSLKPLHQLENRREVAQFYLQVSYRWHQGDFSNIEALMPQITTYRTAIAHF